MEDSTMTPSRERLPFGQMKWFRVFTRFGIRIVSYNRSWARG